MDDKNVNNVEESDIIFQTCSQPVLSSQTPNANKRSKPDSPDTLPASQRQTGRQIRRRNSVGDLRELTSKKPSVSKKSIADKVLEALSSPEVLNQVIPVLSQKISESISVLIDDKIQSSLDECVKPLTETIKQQKEIIEDHKQKLCSQFIKIQGLESALHQQATNLAQNNKEIDDLYNKIGLLEDRLEQQEQYSRRTSLRFHNITVPVDQRGRIKHPVDTDKLVLDVCNKKLGLSLSVEDISRSHVIGKVRDGKSQVIVRFLSYRVRNMVYVNKKKLKDDPDGHFITENLTPYRTNLVLKLSKLKYDGSIHTYWTADGKILAMKSESGRRRVINNFEDIGRLVRQPLETSQAESHIDEQFSNDHHENQSQEST